MRKRIKPLLLGLLASVAVTGSIFLPGLTSSAKANQSINVEFPIAPSAADQFNWVDTWHAPRGGGRLHLGVDLFGPKMAPVVAVESGHITWGRYKNDMPLGGNFLEITGNSGRRYYYTHLNNDTPGTDDGQASCDKVFPSKICSKVDATTGEIRAEIPVTAGELIGYNGDSGNAEGTPPHIHFEILVPNGGTANTGNVYDIEVRNDDWDEVNPTAIMDSAYARLKNNFSPAALIQDHGSNQAQLTRLYYTFFNRGPDNSGYTYWLTQIDRGSTIEEIATYFESSTEFSKRFDNTTDTQYVEFLYNRVLNRSSDTKGKQYWLSQLRAGNLERNTMVVYFAQSTELTTKLKLKTEAVAAYSYYFGRVPDPQDTASWVKLRKSKNTDQAIDAVFN